MCRHILFCGRGWKFGNNTVDHNPWPGKERGQSQKEDLAETCPFENKRPCGITFLKPVSSPGEAENVWLEVKDPGTQISHGPGWECGLYTSLAFRVTSLLWASISVAESVFYSPHSKEKSTCFSILIHATCSWTEGRREVLVNGIQILPGMPPQSCPEILSAFSSLLQSRSC